MKKVTTTVIAETAGVSQTTVSMILSGRPSSGISEETRQRVLKTAADLGYVYKRKSKPRREQSHVIGLLIPTLTIPFFSYAASCIEQYCYANGYNVILCNMSRETEREPDYLTRLIAQRVDGIIVTYTPSNPDYLVHINRSIPVIIMGESDVRHNLQTIGINSEKTGQIIASYLYELGHRKIAMLSQPTSRISLTRPRRIAGIRKFLKSKGADDTFYVLEADYENEYENDRVYEAEIGLSLASRLVENYDVTAIVASDLVVPGVYKVLQSAGLKIPQDMSVVGIDNNFLCALLSPSLTSVEHHLRDRSKTAVEQLILRIETDRGDNTYSYLVEYSPSLIIRESCCSPKA